MIQATLYPGERLGEVVACLHLQDKSVLEQVTALALEVLWDISTDIRLHYDITLRDFVLSIGNCTKEQLTVFTRLTGIECMLVCSSAISKPNETMRTFRQLN